MRLFATLALAFALTHGVAAQATSQAPTAAPQAPAVDEGITPPDDYVIGPEDVLSIVVWREKDLSTDVMVRPDGMVTLPLLNDVLAAGRTPQQLRDELTRAASRFVASPNVTVIVRTINSRRVFITGEVAKPGPYPLGGPLTVLQLITVAGGLNEFADAKNITIVRVENGKSTRFKFNYRDYARGRNVEQNVLLKPGDTVIVP